MKRRNRDEKNSLQLFPIRYKNLSSRPLKDADTVVFNHLV